MFGRPTVFTQELADEICERIACAESLKTIVKDAHMPSERSVFRWLIANTDFCQQYTRAHEAQGDANADNVTHIAERVLSGELDASAGRVAIDAYKWAAGKRNTKKYGDKVAVDHSGTVNHPITELSEAQILARLADLQSAAKPE